MTKVQTPRTSSLRDRPAYPLLEAARYVRVPAATLRSWILGRPYATARGVKHWPALIRVADRPSGALSFNNLIEAHVLRSLRLDHQANIGDIRTALVYAESELGIRQLLLSRELCTNAGELFLDRLGELISLSHSGQFAMKRMLALHLRRVEWDESGLPFRLFPFSRADESVGRRAIAIDPAIGFGRPILLKRSIATHIVAERIDAGETPRAVARDYGLSMAEVEDAILYERTAA